ncbi:cation:proton antiporter, partial [Candidatus Kuenenbacteria bacterium]|nr:cation:proton antiporter [Candidatus Kuenenbacteria bacterium]
MKLLKQPLIVGYIVTGIIVGPSVTNLIPADGALEGFSHIGVALLLFLVGLGLKPSMIREVGKVAVVTGVAQMMVTAIGGYFIAIWLGLSQVTAFYLGIAFALSSTIIIFRILYEKEEQDTLYGRITIGFLLVQDLVAMFFLMFLSSTRSFGSGNYISFASALLGKVALVVIGLYILIKFVIPHVDKIFAKNKEMLFVFALGICFAIAAIFHQLHFSMELGALLAGVILSVSPYQREIALRIQSLRDFFLIIFFVVLGANIHIAEIQNSIPLIVIFSLFILVGNPLILLFVMRWLKYTVKTSFLAGLTVSQISEFSLIILGMGVGLGHIPEAILGPATIVGIITITVSTYYISYNSQIYSFFKKPLHMIFSDKGKKKEEKIIKDQFDVILFGSHRLGGGLVNEMLKSKIKFLIVDHDPEVIRELTSKGLNCIYGSADDADFLDSLPMRSTKLVISTIPELDVNLSIIAYKKKNHLRTNILCIANHHIHADKLYKAGATYVIMPPYLGRRFMADLFKKNKLDHSKYKEERNKHIFDMQYIDELS